MNKNDEYQNETHKLFGEGLIRLAEEHPNIKPTRAALAEFLGRNASYVKDDEKIKWHSDIIDRCKIATGEFIRQKNIKEKRKKQRETTVIQKLKDEIAQLTKDVEETRLKLKESREKELYLYQAWKGAQEKLDEIENNSMAAWAANNSWRE